MKERKIAFLFPGQGSQSVGMGKDLYNKFECVKEIYDIVEKITGINISKISFDGPEETVNEIQNTQLAVLVESLAILEILKQNNINADVLTGLSLGEYTALIHSGCLSFEQGVKLVQKRGQFMQNLVPSGEWQMAAILGLSESQVEDICKKVSLGFVAPANYNCDGQIAISGEKVAVNEASQIAKEMGAKKVIVLKTAGPFHTKKMQKASEAFKNEVNNITINKFDIKVIKNLDGNFYKETDDVKDILVKHIINPVRFTKTIQTMLNEGINTFIDANALNSTVESQSLLKQSGRMHRLLFFYQPMKVSKIDCNHDRFLLIGKYRFFLTRNLKML